MRYQILFAMKLYLFLLISNVYSVKESCSDFQQINSFNNLEWNYTNLSAPWNIFPQTKIYSSNCFENNINVFLAKLIPGSNLTFSEFFSELRSRGCVFYPHGGFIRDLVNNRYPHDLDGQYSCSKEKMLNSCIEITSPGFCYLDMNISFFYLGNHSLEAFSWDQSFFSLVDQEYTPDSLYYDPVNHLIIDLSGMGLEDILNIQIRIPVEKNQWEYWLLRPNQEKNNGKMFGLRKVPRYWKLKQIGFSDYDIQTVSFLKQKIASLWNNPEFPMKIAFIQHFCWILQGIYDENQNNFCQPKNGTQFTERNIRKCKDFGNFLWNELYDMPKSIKKDLKTIINDMGCLHSMLMNISLGMLVFILYLIYHL